LQGEPTTQQPPTPPYQDDPNSLWNSGRREPDPAAPPTSDDPARREGAR
jgi:hypothetical protein